MNRLTHEIPDTLAPFVDLLQVAGPLRGTRPTTTRLPGHPATSFVLSLCLIGKVALVSHFLDLMELRFEPVHVLFFVLQQLREQFA